MNSLYNILKPGQDSFLTHTMTNICHSYKIVTRKYLESLIGEENKKHYDKEKDILVYFRSSDKETCIAVNPDKWGPPMVLTQMVCDTSPGYYAKEDPDLYRSLVSRNSEGQFMIPNQKYVGPVWPEGKKTDDVLDDKNNSSKTDCNMEKCVVCEKMCTKRCSKCKTAYYCSAECQLKDWGVHKTSCLLRVTRKKILKVYEDHLCEKECGFVNINELHHPSLYSPPVMTPTPSYLSSINSPLYYDSEFIDTNMMDENDNVNEVNEPESDEDGGIELVNSTIKDKEKEIPKDQTACSICISDFEIGDRITRLKCMHIYHNSCINGWFKEENTCPICRTKFKSHGNYHEGEYGSLLMEDVE